MKATVKQVVDCYNAFEKAKVNKLEESEKIKILKARKVMRPIHADFEAFLKDVQEMMKPENWDELQAKAQKWQQEGEKTTLTKEEQNEINKSMEAYLKKVDSAVKDELAKEVEINIEKLKENSDIKLLEENDWEIGKLNLIEILL